MTTYVSVVTETGKNRALGLTFGGTGDPMAYMGLGTSKVEPTEALNALVAEVDDESYSRVALVNIYPESEGGVSKQVTSEGTFEQINLTVETEINEIGIFDDETGGDAFCIVKIPPTTKDGNKQIKFTITNSMA